MRTDQDALPGEAVLPVAALDPGGGWTVDDLDALPDDGLRRELVDGVLLVSPAPRIRHQAVVVTLYDLLRPASPPEGAVAVTRPFPVTVAPGALVPPRG